MLAPIEESTAVTHVPILVPRITKSMPLPPPPIRRPFCAITMSTEVTALDDWTMPVTATPMRRSRRGFVTEVSACSTNGSLATPAIEPDIISRPTNTRPREATRLPAVFTLLFLVTIVNIRPISVKSMAYIITLN